MNRRHFLRHSSLTAATILAGVRSAHGAGFTATKTTQSSPAGYFTLGRAGADGRWLFLDPDGKPFFSLGLNHIDPATIRYPENIHLWRDKYGNSMQRWLKESVRPNLEEWGFNSVGWVQEVITRQPTNHRHSRNFTAEEYQWLGMPYGHMLPFADFHQWEAETKHPDFFSPGFGVKGPRWVSKKYSYGGPDWNAVAGIRKAAFVASNSPRSLRQVTTRTVERMPCPRSASSRWFSRRG